MYTITYKDGLSYANPSLYLLGQSSLIVPKVSVQSGTIEPSLHDTRWKIMSGRSHHLTAIGNSHRFAIVTMSPIGVVFSAVTCFSLCLSVFVVKSKTRRGFSVSVNSSVNAPHTGCSFLLLQGFWCGWGCWQYNVDSYTMTLMPFCASRWVRP